MLLNLALCVFSGLLLLRVLITVRLETITGIGRSRLTIGELALPLAAAVLALLAGTDTIALNRYVILGIGVLLVGDGIARWAFARVRPEK